MYTPQKYRGTDLEKTAQILNVGFWTIPAIISISLIRQLAHSDYQMAGILATGLFLSFLTRMVFIRGYLTQAILIVSISFSILLAVICSLGYGVHDLGIMGFPLLISFSSLLLNKRELLIASSLSVAGLAWVVVGEKLGFYTSLQAIPGESADFIIAGSMITLGGFIAFSLTNSVKNSLSEVNNQIQSSRVEAQKLQDEILQKEEIIEEIHRAVINSLEQLEVIIKENATNKNSKDHYQKIELKTLIIKTAHEILLQNKSPLVLNLTDFAANLLRRIQPNLQSQNLQININPQQVVQVAVDQAIYFGICLAELLQKQGTKASQVTLKVSRDGNVELLIISSEELEETEDELIIGLLLQQLKADLIRDNHSLQVNFKAKVAK